MNLDQSFYGYQDWNLPSPSSSPKSSPLNDALLQTPKVDQSSTHFLDAYSTPHINGHNTPAQTPLFSNSAASAHPTNSHLHKRPEDPEFHVNHFTSNHHLALPPVEPARRLSSSLGPLLITEKPREGARGQLPPDSSVRSEMDSSFMQTPPPTRDSSRRKLATGSTHHLTTPSTVIARSASTPLTGHNTFSHTPVQFPALPFSPEAIQFPNAGPSSAPVFPQSRIFWDQPQDGTSRDVEMTNIPQDRFGPTPQRFNSSFSWPFASPSPPSSSNAFQPSTDPQLASQVISSGHNDNSSQNRNYSFSQAGSFMPATAGVDPTMLFSFNVGTNSFENIVGQSVQPQNAEGAGRQPYEHQIRESLREKEEARKVKQNHSRSSTASSSVSFGSSGRPGLQRSKTDSGLRSGHNVSMDTRGAAGGLPNIPRKTSPLKRLSTGLSAIPEISKTRPRTRLVIDESGRARTETDPHPEEQDSHADPRSQYPGLWSDDESASEDDKPVNSRPSSFIFDALPRRSSKHGRLDSLGRSGSMKKARPSSMIALQTSPLEHTDGAYESFQDTRRFSGSGIGGSFSISPSKEAALSPTEGAGHAQNALKRVVEDRMRRQERSAQNTLKAHNQRWSQASAEMIKPTSGPSINVAAFSDAMDASPSTMTDFTELDTPSTNRSSLSNSSTRCVCNSPDGDGQLMIQCESCTKWLHTQCVGLDDRSLPSVYLCVFCTSTPARGGRISQNIRPIAAYASPLTHKSTYRR